MGKTHLPKSVGLLALLACLACALPAQPGEEEPELEIVNGRKVAPGSLYIVIDKSRLAEVRNNLAQREFRPARLSNAQEAGWWKFDKLLTVPEALKIVRQIPGVVRAHPDGVYELYGAGGRNDAYYPLQYALPMMDLPQAWKLLGTFDPIVVGVLDTGMSVGLTEQTPPHVDIGDNIYANPGEVLDNEDNDQNSFIDDLHGWDFDGDDNDPSGGHEHGTWVAGVIGAVSNNTTGIAGAVPYVRILPLKVSIGASGIIQESYCCDAIDYCILQRVPVVNMSFGGTYTNNPFLLHLQNIQDNGVLVIAAAGNSSEDLEDNGHFPACYSLANIVSVIATNEVDNMTHFSSYAEATVDLAAPGDRTTTTSPPNGYMDVDGTSFSAPYVASVAALLLAKYPAPNPNPNPGLYIRQLRLMILEGADPVPCLRGKCVTSGRANAYQTLLVPPVKTVSQDKTETIAIPDNGDWRTSSLTFPTELKVRDVSVSVTMDHEQLEDLEIKVISPSEDEFVILKPAPEGSYTGPWPSGRAFVFDTSWAFRGLQSAGTWQLAIRDTVTNSLDGDLQAWEIEVHTYDDSNDVKSGGGILCTNSSNVTISNSIVYGNTSPAPAGHELVVASDASPSTASVSYCDIDGGQNAVQVDAGCTLTWGTGNIDADPKFYAPESRDYHVKSVYGRWNPAQSGWAIDAETSPCIDAGDPATLFPNELDPRGYRINMGAYGNTEQASKYQMWPIQGDTNLDCFVNIMDLIFIRNRMNQSIGSGDNWQANANSDLSINILDLIYVRARLGNTCQ
ncbi:MAG TPA: S8 family serine peptidase [bacterium]|nr:S8 family serine peptidase [bacterium]